MFTLIVYDKKNPKTTMLKRRILKKPQQPILKYGNIGIVAGKNMRFEFVYFFFIRKFIKKIYKKKKFFRKTKKTWIFIRPNYILTKKAKNARMGKGKGGFIRWCTNLVKGFNLIEFEGFSYMHVYKYKIKLEKRIKIPLNLIIRPDNLKKNQRTKYFGSTQTLFDFKQKL